MRPYFILGYPRTRQAWLAVAMSCGQSACLFEGTWGCVSIEDIAHKLSVTAAPCPGNADCVNAVILDRLLERWPHARLVVVTRDTDAVAESLRRLGIEPDPQSLQAIRRGLDHATQLDQTLVVPFEDVGRADIGRAIWEHCTGIGDFDARRWQMLEELNVQVRPAIENEKVRTLGMAMRRLVGGQDT